MAFDYPDIANAEKSLASVQEWAEVGNRKVGLVHPLDIDGVTQEGLVLRMIAIIDQPNADVRAFIQCALPGQRPRAIDAIDWKPKHDHYNRKGPEHLKFKKITRTHWHRFDLNWLADEGRFLTGNLPVADKVDPEPERFVDFLEFTAKSFRINSLQDIVPPPWDDGLFGSYP